MGELSQWYQARVLEIVRRKWLPEPRQTLPRMNLSWVHSQLPYTGLEITGGNDSRLSVKESFMKT